MNRRSLLSALARFYDPLGVISPILHHAKLLHQMHYENYEWDLVVTRELLRENENWCSYICQIREINIPRHVNTKKVIS